MANIKGVTKAGEVVDSGAVGVAHVVDMDDQPSADLLIESIKTRYAKENPSTTPHLAVNGVAVPVTVEDTETPQEKLVRLQGEGVLQTGSIVATTQGFKTESELGESGLGVDDASKSVHDAGTHSNLSGEGNQGGTPDDQGEHTNTPEVIEQNAMIEALTEPIAQKLFDAGLRSRADLAAKTDAELDAIPGIGAASIEKIKAFLGA